MTTTTELDDLFEANRFLAEVAAERREALWRAILNRDTGGVPIPEKVSEDWDKGNAMLNKSATKLAMNSPTGTVVQTADGPMIVVSISTISAAVVHNEPIEVVLTQDGGVALRSWHEPEDGPPGEPLVRYEVYTAEGRTRHGYLSPVSRKIAQTG